MSYKTVMKRIVISGAGGFLGNTITKAAISKGIEVIAISTKAIEIPNVITINTKDFLEKGYSHRTGDVFINCFFPTNADGFKMADGLEKIFIIINRAKQSGVTHFINISSQSVYDSNRLSPASEKDVICIDSPYKAGKYCTEKYVENVFMNDNFTNIRLGSLIGAGYDQRIINRLTESAILNHSMTVIGGMQRYSFLDVRDAAEAIIRVAVSEQIEWKCVYNLGTKESYNLLEIVNKLKDVLKDNQREVDIIIKDGNDKRNSAINAGLFMNTFDWKPKYSIDDTILEIVQDKLNMVNN